MKRVDNTRRYANIYSRSQEPLRPDGQAPHAESMERQPLLEEMEEGPQNEPDEEDPVQDEFLELLVEKELGEVGPRFAVPKIEDAALEREASLKRLLDDEWGPPRFAVHKPATIMEVEGEEGTSSDDAIANQLSNERQAMKLTVTTGPCAGISYDSLSGPLEIVIGRVPASTFPISDQEISSKHAVIHYAPKEDCWKVVSLVLFGEISI